MNTSWSLIPNAIAGDSKEIAVKSNLPKNVHASATSTDSGTCYGSNNSKVSHMREPVTSNTQQSAAETSTGAKVVIVGRLRNHNATYWQIFHLIHRIFILIAAIYYVIISIRGSFASVQLLVGIHEAEEVFIPYEAPLMAQLVGNATLRESPLVVQYLNDSTEPIEDTLYFDLPNASYTSRESCTKYMEDIDPIYSNTYQRQVYQAIVNGASYNLDFLSEQHIELIAPIVDCLCTSRVFEDSTAAKFFFLVRSVEDHEQVFIMTLVQSNQDYMIVDRHENGAAAVATLSIINDMQATEVDHHFLVSIGYPFEHFNFQVYEYVGLNEDSLWVLQNIPRNSTAEISKLILTGCRVGIYLGSENEQSNLRNEYWSLDSKPIEVISTWTWKSGPILRDSWGWVHWVHIFLSLDLFFHLSVLLLVAFRNFQRGNLWIGDSFVSISKTIRFRGFLILFTWVVNRFWSVMEFCIHDVNIIAKVEEILIKENIMKADLIGIYLSAVGYIGIVTNERIDPALSVFLFVLGFETRSYVITWFPSIVKLFYEFALEDYLRGIVPSPPNLDMISPMKLWSCHEVGTSKNPYLGVNITEGMDIYIPSITSGGVPLKVVLGILFPIFLTLVLLLLYILIRKLYRRVDANRVEFVPDAAKRALEKRSTTQFEKATGTELEYQFGILSDYENFRFIKGLKYVSPDGIYSNGFVIANKKYLVQVEDLRIILLMKMFKTRKFFRNVYVYDIEGFTIQPMARIVYPETFSAKDLEHLNISILS